MSPTPRWTISLKEARDLLRAVGMRCTPARIAVVQCLSSGGSPLTPVEVATELADYGFDKSTIYRSLSELDAAGIVHRLDLGDSHRRFEMQPSGRAASDHPHFMCIDCGDVQCLADFQVELKPPQQQPAAFGIISEVLVRGHCRNCVADV